MPKEPEHRFTLLDAMALVAATAVGLAVWREWSRMVSTRWNGAAPEVGLLADLAPLTRQVVLSWPVVAMWSFALVALRLRAPRPPRRRLFAPPGVAACLVAAVVIALELAYIAVILAEDYVTFPRPMHTAARWYELESWAIRATTSTSIGFAVLAAWAAMALDRRWRPEPSWIDRAGRVVGCLWIVLIVLRFHLRTNSHLNV